MHLRWLALAPLLVACGDVDSVRTLPDAPTIDGPAIDGPPDSPPDAPDTQEVVDLTFEGALPPSVDVGTSGELTPSQGYEPLGPTGGTFGPTFLRSKTGNTITITATNLPPHRTVTLEFLFAAIDSLDGTGSFPAGDFMRITLDDVQIFRESFANAELSQIQSYVAPPGGELARRVDLGFSGPGGFYTDSAYDMAVDPRFHDLPHTADSATLVFTLEGEGVQNLEDESWAIDNVRLLVHR